MLYTSEQLLTIYNSSQSGWIMLRNDDVQDPSADVSKVVPSSGAIESNGIWKVHLSIASKDMVRAIPIIQAQFCDPNTPRMGMKVTSKQLLAGDHQSGKQVAFIFDRATEVSQEGHKKIVLFLGLLALKLEKAGIKPEEKPPLTIETEAQVRDHGSAADKKNIDGGKYDATIKFRANELLSYFNYRDEMALLFDDDCYNMMGDSHPGERARMVKRSVFNQWNKDNHPQYKHNPLKRTDDFLYGVVLESKLSLSPSVPMSTGSQAIAQMPTINEDNKENFLKALAAKIKEPSFTRANILELFSQIKNPGGDYRYIHQQRNPMWYKVQLFFKSAVSSQNENNFWHTATYQKAIKLLKQAYIDRGMLDLSAYNRPQEVNAFVDYVRGNSPVHFGKTSTRNLLK